MKKFRSKYEVEAVQFTGALSDELKEFLGPDRYEVMHHRYIDYLRVYGDRTSIAHPGDWVVRDRWGKLHVYHGRDFAEGYEEVQEPAGLSQITSVDDWSGIWRGQDAAGTLTEADLFKRLR